jgi:hypothetical protein
MAPSSWWNKLPVAMRVQMAGLEAADAQLGRDVAGLRIPSEEE